MPRTARGSLVAAAVSIAVLVAAGAEAFGGLPLGGTAPRLSATQSLSVSVPSVAVPSVPHVSTPSVPSVSVPSVPSVPSAPSVPSVPSGTSVPRLANGAVPSTSSLRTPGVGAQRPGVTSRGGLGSSTAAGAGSGPGAASANSPSARASQRRARIHAARRHRAAEGRLRRDVRRFAGCLGVLSSSQRRVLSLRAGVDGSAPLSRLATARRLGISRGRVANLEHHGLRALRAAGESGACGAGGAGGEGSSGGTAAAGALARGPQLEPAVMLTPRPALKSPAALAGRRRGRHAVKGARASSGRAASGGHTTAVVHAAETSSSVPAYPFGIGALVLLMGATLLVLRRRAHAQPATQAPVAPPTSFFPATATQASDTPEAPAEPPVTAPEPAPEHVTPEPAPMPAPPEPARRGPVRQAAVIAASLASLVATGLLRRRRRRR